MRHNCGRTHTNRLRREWPEIRAVRRPHDEVARIAYFIWEKRGRQHGSAEEDWYRAEREWDERNGRE